MAKIYATRNPEISAREIRNMNRARKIAAQGMVLLENRGVLPLINVKRIAAFGSGIRKTIKGGIGSGDVNSRLIVNVEQGLEEAGFAITTKTWLDEYDSTCEKSLEQMMQHVMSLLAEKGQDALTELLAQRPGEPEVPKITKAVIESTKADVAIYVISRKSGEGADRDITPGDYELSEIERHNVKVLAEAYGNLIVALNVGGVIDTKFLREQEGIGALLLMSQGGNISGSALADVLTGKETPSGHLAMTWAENYSDYPSASSFSHLSGNVDDAWYNEGIYVGYRYFDTFGIRPAYPFGYGLSYTEFNIEPIGVLIRGESLTVQIRVTNVGKRYSGREVVQVYYSSPAGTIEKPYQELAGFAKTKVLQPGESDLLKIEFPIRAMASYDESRSAFVLEPGKYYIRVGNHSRNTHVVAAMVVEDEKITRRFQNRLCLDQPISELSAANSVPYTYPTEAAEKAHATQIYLITSILPTRDAEYSQPNSRITTKWEENVTLEDILVGEATTEDLIAQLSPEELALMCVGTARGGFFGTSVIGAASTACPGAAGDTTSALLESRGIPNLVLADGPAGLRLSKSFVADSHDVIIPGLGESALGGMEKIFGQAAPEPPADAVDYYQYCTAIPIATMLAQTWDMEAISAAGDIVGEEMEEFGITLWLAPGMNIQRNPLCGRNFEYYSEDPWLSGMCAAADTAGVQRHPACGTTIKHFALNNQEDNRSFCNSHCGERTLREIYLRGFEIAVKKAQPLALMTSYNLINGEHAANRYELITSVLRDEWGFKGIVMTDWGTTGGGSLETAAPRKYPTSNAAGCIKAGNDLIMPGSQEDIDQILESLDAPIESVPYPISLADLQACAHRILKLIVQCEKDRRKAP